jgi:hypothetical protein
MTPREASLVVWTLAECGHPSRSLLTAAMAAYGDVWHISLGYYEMARLINSFSKSGYYPWSFVDRVRRAEVHAAPPMCKGLSCAPAPRRTPHVRQTAY